jgi:hypothetical protein
LQQSLLAKEVEATPAPSPLRIQALAQILPALDPLERLALYHGADAADQRAIEEVNRALSRLPVKREGRGTAWESMLPDDAIADVVQQRAARVDQAAAARLADLQAIRNAYRGLAGSARALVKGSLPRGAEV